MFKKKEVPSAQENAQVKHELKEGECGGCGTFENVTENSCIECAKGYSEADGVPLFPMRDYQPSNEWMKEFYKDQIIK